MALPYCRYCDNLAAADALTCPRCGGPLEFPGDASAGAAAGPRYAEHPTFGLSYAEHPAYGASPDDPAAYSSPGAAATIPDDVLYPVAIFKLVAMSVCTFGLYEMFWFYRNWRRIRQRTGRSLSPFWRMAFAQFWSFSLFEEVMQEADAAGVRYRWNSVLLGIAFFVLLVCSRLPQPWFLLSIFSFVPLVPVQVTINRIARRRGIRVDADFGVWHVALVLLVSGLVVLAAIGALLPPG
jgi:hypothetical protein